MSAAARHSPNSDAARWSIGPLTTYADPAAMAAWLDDAAPGAKMVYAAGPLLGEHPAVALAARWQAAGRVHLFQRKAERAHCTDYCVEKRPDDAPRSPAAAPRSAKAKAVQTDLARLTRLLRSLAARGEPCPSMAEIARKLELARGNRGRRRAQYLLDTLEREGRVRIDRRGGGAAIRIANGRSKLKGESR